MFPQLLHSCYCRILSHLSFRKKGGTGGSEPGQARGEGKAVLTKAPVREGPSWGLRAHFFPIASSPRYGRGIAICPLQVQSWELGTISVLQTRKLSL